MTLSRLSSPQQIKSAKAELPARPAQCVLVGDRTPRGFNTNYFPQSKHVVALSQTVGMEDRGGEHGRLIPRDFETIMGHMLPHSVYVLMCTGMISAKLPLALARGEWLDKTQPLVDSGEYRQLLEDLDEYRGKALGL